MGSSQSNEKANNDQADAEAQNRDLYKVLGVDESVGQDEIKRAYKLKALELHPDRNYGAVEEATKLFTEVQTAFEILSDPQERAWYDSHRQEILRGFDGPNQPESEQAPAQSFTRDLLSAFSLFSSRMSFSDEDPNGFYKLADQIFDRISSDEVAAARRSGHDPEFYPEFGNSHMSYEDFVKNFYSTWMNFRTFKAFESADKYRMRDAPDRRTKRFMEKENKKMRENAIKEYNDAVKQFVAFIRKRDPRYKPNFQSAEERNEAAKAAAKMQSQRDRAANAAKASKFTAAEWTVADIPEDHHDEGTSGDEIVELEEFHCVACGKFFKSKNQADAHERSKKHKRNIYAMQKKMKAENSEFDLTTGPEDPEHENLPQENDGSSRSMQGCNSEQDPEMSETELQSWHHESANAYSGRRYETSESENSDGQTEILPVRKINALAINEQPPCTSPNIDDHDAPDVYEGDIPRSQKKKRGAAKEKRAKRAEKLKLEDYRKDQLRHYCVVCGNDFTSRSKLFQHLETSGHAAPTTFGRQANRRKPKLQ